MTEEQKKKDVLLLYRFNIAVDLLDGCLVDMQSRIDKEKLKGVKMRHKDQQDLSILRTMAKTYIKKKDGIYKESAEAWSDIAEKANELIDDLLNDKVKFEK